MTATPRRTDGQIYAEAINLEGCNDDELRDISADMSVHIDVREIATKLTQSRKLRRSGAIRAACRIESHVEALYNVLPKHLRW